MAVADSQGISVTWGSVSLGKLTNVVKQSPQVDYEEIFTVNNAVVTYTDNAGKTTHHGAVKRMIASDITPGTLSIQWIGSGGLRDSHIGQSKTLTVTHPNGAIAVSVSASLKTYQITGAVGELIKGSAEFQLEGI